MGFIRHRCGYPNPPLPSRPSSSGSYILSPPMHKAELHSPLSLRSTVSAPIQPLFSGANIHHLRNETREESFRWPKSAISSNRSILCIGQLQSLLTTAQKGEDLNALLSMLQEGVTSMLGILNFKNSIPYLSILLMKFKI